MPTFCRVTVNRYDGFYLNSNLAFPQPTGLLDNGAYNNRNGPERTGMDRNAPEWTSITGMDIKFNLFYAAKFIFLPLFILKFQFLLILHLLKCIGAPSVVCYMVDVNAFKLCQFILKMHILYK